MLTVELAAWERMVAHAIAECPKECVGLLVGDGDLAYRPLRLANVHPHPTLFYAVDRIDQFLAYTAIDRAGLRLMAVYHSHVGAPPEPSRTDVDRGAPLGRAVRHVIVSVPATGAPQARAWRYTPAGRVLAESVRIVADGSRSGPSGRRPGT